MPYGHPYRENGGKEPPRNGETTGSGRQGGDWERDLETAVQDIVSAGEEIGSTVLRSLSDVLGELGNGLGRRGKQKEQTFAQWRSAMDRRLQNSEQSGWLGAAVGGWFFAASFGIAALVMLTLTAVGAAPLGIPESDFLTFPLLGAMFSVFTVGFGIMGGIGVSRYRYYGRLRRYIHGARDWVCSVPALARAALGDVNTVRKELAMAAADGTLPGVCLSEDENTVYFKEQLYTPQREPSPAPETKTEQGPQPALTPLELFEKDGAEFLRYLGKCQGKLDPAADEELVQMEKTCAQILGFIHNHPDQLDRVRRFSEYYLPTTRKLLDTALGLSATESENAKAIRRDITGILHTLNMAYVKLYDTLLEEVSMDVSTEIDTLETMLRQDGLTHDFASDFGAQG